MQVKIVIISRTGTEADTCVAEGDFCKKDDGFAITYSLDGDSCSLSFGGKSVCQQRSGKINYFVKFTAGERCFFEFTEGGYSFSRGVDVTKAEGVLTEGGCRIQVSYSDEGITDIFVKADYIK